jgi:hypothetical protein
MKFIHYLESIAGVGIYPLISLLIFFAFFTTLFLYVMRADKKHIANLKNMPLEHGKNSETLNRKP